MAEADQKLAEAEKEAREKAEAAQKLAEAEKEAREKAEAAQKLAEAEKEAREKAEADQKLAEAEKEAREKAEAAQKLAAAEKEAREKAEAAQKLAAAEKEAREKAEEAEKEAREKAEAAQKLAEAEKEAREKCEAAQTLVPSSPAPSIPMARHLNFDSQQTLLLSPQSTDAYFGLHQVAEPFYEHVWKDKNEPNAPPLKRLKSWEWSDEDWMQWRQNESWKWDSHWQGGGWKHHGSGWSNWSGGDAEWEEQQRLLRPNTFERWGSFNTVFDDTLRDGEEAPEEPDEAGPSHSKEGSCMRVCFSLLPIFFSFPGLADGLRLMLAARGFPRCVLVGGECR